MAIHSDYPGVKAEVIVGGQAVKEYDDPNDTSQANTVTKYIEAVSGAYFYAQVQIDPGILSKDTSASMALDGKWSVRSLFRLGSEKKEAKLHRVWKKINNRWLVSEVCFSELSVTEEDSAGRNFEAERLGTIQIDISHASNVSRRPRKRPTERSIKEAKSYEDVTDISEETLKGQIRSHCTSLKFKEPTDKWVRSWETTVPFLTFQFKYRSFAALQLLDIIPRHPDPQRVPSPLQVIKRNPSASPPIRTTHESAPATDEERPPTTKNERPPTPTGMLHDLTPTSEHRMANNNVTPAQVLGMEMADNPSASMLRESRLTGDHHTANVEDTSHHVPSSSEHEDHPSTRALAVPTQTSEQDMSDNVVELTQVLDRVIGGSSSSTALHRSSFPIEDNKADVELGHSNAIEQNKDYNGLTKQEIIVVLAGYRGHEGGLAGLQRKALLSMLKFYEQQDEGTSSVKRKPARDGRSGLHVKREHDDSELATSSRKRGKREVIVLDD